MSEKSQRIAQFVMKISKLCNLRCRYCYEMNELDQTAIMSRDELRRIYANIREHYVARDHADNARTEVRFIWHGGEPLLVEPAQYWQTFEDQRDIFGPDQPLQNTVQTNLTILDEERIRLLRDGFQSFGVSVDLFGGLRVNLAGRDQQRRVLRNMDVLRAEGLRFGGLTVLTKLNIGHVREIFRFYERAKLGFRVLPLFAGAFDGQHDDYELTSAEIVEAYRTLIDLWLQSNEPPEILPLTGYLKATAYALDGGTAGYFNKRDWNPAILVNIDGELFHTADPYGDPTWSLGNLIKTPLSRIVASPQMEKSLHEAERRLAFNCTRCRFFGKACSGYPVVEEQSNCRELDDGGIPVCVVEKQTFEHIERRLRQAGLAAAET